MKRLLCFLISAAGLAAAGETVELSAASPRDAKVTGTLTIARLEAQVTMRGVLAETQATLTLAMESDPAQRMEGRLVFPLPADCVVTGAALDIGDLMRPASMTFQSTAKQAYDSVVSRMLDPCLIQLLPDGRVSAQVFPFSGGVPRKLRLEFAQTILQGTKWQFPLTFAAPVPEAVLKADAPVVSGTEERRNFRGGAEWSFTAPTQFAEDLQAHPDGNGRWFFQTILPPGELAEPPRHVLLLADVSLLQAKRDAAAERAFVERLFQRMQSGRLTLATFSTALHSRTEFEVREGRCSEVLAALAAVKFDGAPRPDAVDVSGIPADLTLVLSTLTAPMGGSTVPRLPANAPVWVLDSVSPAPAAAAVYLAAQTGGMTIEPRAAPEISFRRRQAVTTENLAGISFRPMGDGAWLVSGELSGERGAFTAGGKTMTVTKGTDSIAGALIARQRARENFVRLGAEQAGLLRREMHNSLGTAPCLTETTAFIVLEQVRDYERWNIPLPPDLERVATHAADWQEQSDRAAYAEYDRALQRPASTSGEPLEWYKRLESNEKRFAVRQKLGNDARFRNLRYPLRRFIDDFGLADDPELKKLQEREARAQTELKVLADQFSAFGREQTLDLIRRAREQQMHRAALSAWLEDAVGAFHSGGGPGIDPFSGPSWISDMGDRPGVDPFATSDADAITGTPPIAGTGTGASAVQTAQTFGGAGPVPWGRGLDYYRRPNPFSAQGGQNTDPREVTWADTIVGSKEIIDRATALHRAGRKPEALRALSSLAIPVQHNHALLRLLAWVLTEWSEHSIALEVLQHAERKFGSTDVTARDLALAELALGKRDDALRHFRAAWHHVSRRDAFALDGRMSAALRIVLECAGSSADADLEIEGPDYELCSWRHPAPAFGGTLSFDGSGMDPEDFVLPTPPSQPLKVRVRLTDSSPQPLRVTVIEEWGRPGEKRQVFLLPAAQPGMTNVAEIAAVK